MEEKDARMKMGSRILQWPEEYLYCAPEQAQAQIGRPVNHANDIEKEREPRTIATKTANTTRPVPTKATDMWQFGCTM
jgi:hypothetical protein